MTTPPLPPKPNAGDGWTWDGHQWVYTPSSSLPARRPEAPKPPDDPVWRKWATGIAVLCMLGIVAGAVYDKSKQSEPDPSLSSNSVTPQDPDLPSVTTSSDPYYHNVIYEIGGTARSVSISYDTPLGSNDESHLMPPGAIFPKRRPLGYRFDPDQYVSISVLNEGLYGSVSCRIIVDNRVVSRSSSDQSFVNCDARTPLPPF